MELTTELSANKLINDLKNEYPGIKDVLVEEDNIICAYADDDTLWQMYDELSGLIKSVEFNSGDQKDNYLRIIF